MEGKFDTSLFMLSMSNLLFLASIVNLSFRTLSTNQAAAVVLLGMLAPP